MNILGINAYHGDSSACLVSDGRIIAAAEEERFRRIKHWAGFPEFAIRYCLREANVSLSDVDVVAINSDPFAHFFKKFAYVLLHRPDIRLVASRLINHHKRNSIPDEFASAFGEPFRGSIVRVEHHLAHMASSYLVSPFNEACIVSIDGFGDFSSTAWGVGRAETIAVEEQVYFPHSLGIFYQALTQYIGFPHYGDEYKVMGLAPYGKPTFLPELRNVVKLKERGRFELDTQYFRHHRERIDYAWDGGSPHVGTLYSPALEQLLGPARHRDDPLEQKHRNIASSVQAMYEEAFFHLLNYMHEKCGLDNLTIAGGCAMNSVANGKVARRTNFKRLYVQSAPGDAGGAIGSALYAWYSTPTRGKPDDLSTRVQNSTERSSVLASDSPTNRPVMEHAYLGPSARDDEIVKLLEDQRHLIVDKECTVTFFNCEEDLLGLTAEAISGGEVVGWFQGRMEWGPRALGNRSIVGDPRRADMKDILNLKIKRRESFRPFAPSVLKEHVADWFEEDGDVPFMMQVYQIREEKRPQIPAVTHVDGSGRLQTVYRDTNPRYWLLIDHFRRITGVPMVLNTSFNENEPVVCSPGEALDCFLRTNMDKLVLGNYLISRAVQVHSLATQGRHSSS